MKRFLVVAGLFALVGVALAGIPPSEGGLKAPNDSLTIPRSLALYDAGASITNVDLAVSRNAFQFNIPGMPALSVQCPDAGAWVYTDVISCGPGRGVMVAAGGFLSTGCAKETVLTQNDGGVYKGCVVCIAPLAGASNPQCITHIQRGTFP